METRKERGAQAQTKQAGIISTQATSRHRAVRPRGAGNAQETGQQTMARNQRSNRARASASALPVALPQSHAMNAASERGTDKPQASALRRNAINLNSRRNHNERGGFTTQQDGFHATKLQIGYVTQTTGTQATAEQGKDGSNGVSRLVIVQSGVKQSHADRSCSTQHTTHNQHYNARAGPF